MLLWQHRRRVIAVLLTSIACSVLAAGVIAVRAADRLTAAKPTKVGDPPADFPAEPVSFTSESGDEILGWYASGEPGKGVVVIAHGIRSNRLASLPRARLIAEAGFSTLVFDLRCHGESTGDRITLGWLERHDVAAAVAFAKEKRPGEPVGVVGFSLGGAAAALATPLGVDAVVLEAVFPTVEAAIANRTRRRLGPLGGVGAWALAVQLKPRLGVSTADLRPVEAIGEVGCPVMIVGGRKDHQTPPADTRSLYDAAPEPKQLVWFDEWGHNNFARWAPDRYRSTVVEFLTRELGAANRN